jgi:hypothetical protein
VLEWYSHQIIKKGNHDPDRRCDSRRLFVTVRPRADRGGRLAAHLILFAMIHAIGGPARRARAVNVPFEAGTLARGASPGALESGSLHSSLGSTRRTMKNVISRWPSDQFMRETIDRGERRVFVGRVAPPGNHDGCRRPCRATSCSRGGRPLVQSTSKPLFTASELYLCGI